MNSDDTDESEPRMNSDDTDNNLGTGDELFYGYGFGKIAGLIDVQAAQVGDVVGEQLQGDGVDDW